MMGENNLNIMILKTNCVESLVSLPVLVTLIKEEDAPGA